MAVKNTSQERTPEQLREQFEVEKELAGRLRSANSAERVRLYSVVYDELFRRVPHHPQLTKKADPAERAATVARQLATIRKFLSSQKVFLEVGAGDCALSLAVAPLVKKVLAVETSDEIARNLAAPENFQLVISKDGALPFPPASVDVAYSHQVLEHLHPEDAEEHIRSIAKALTPGGIFVCITPNRLSGPHDISRYFSNSAEGLHLKEYTIGELAKLFRLAGLSKFRVLFGTRGWRLTLPCAPFCLFEKLLECLSLKMSRSLGRLLPSRAILGATVIGIK